MSDKKKILVVDDEISVAMFMVFLLTQAGYAVEAACNEGKAVQLAERMEFDFITLPVNMPNGGFVLYQRLRQIPHQQNTLFVFVSGGRSEEDRQHAFELGAVDYIEKPFSAKDFLARILHLQPDKNLLQAKLTEIGNVEIL